MEKHGIERDTYDAHIIPSETAARKEREGDNYKKIPEGNLEGGAAIIMPSNQKYTMKLLAMQRQSQSQQSRFKQVN
jgi:hypothetical protein